LFLTRDFILVAPVERAVIDVFDVLIILVVLVVVLVVGSAAAADFVMRFRRRRLG
jgi:hypothetical protein